MSHDPRLLWQLLPICIFMACSSSPHSSSDGDADVDASSVVGASDAGEPDGSSGACVQGATGQLVVDVTGLPGDVDPRLHAAGASLDIDLGAVTRADYAPSGSYTVTAERILVDDARVRGLYIPTPASVEVCVREGAETHVAVEYVWVETSHQLWALNDTAGAALLAFSASKLHASAAPAGSHDVGAPAGRDLAFDRDGNLWTFGPTTVDPPLLRYAAATMGGDASAPDRRLEIDGVDCIPGLRAMAFDHDGNLWLSVCGGKLLRLDPALLARGNSRVERVSPAIVLSGLTDNGDVAFDKEGNLWATDAGKVVRYGVDRLASSDAAAPDAAYSLRNAGDSQDISVDYLTFDVDGDLWATSFGGNFVAEIAKADLQRSDADPLVASVSLVLSVSALLNRPAFDDAGGLWISYSANKLARLAPAALTVSTDAGEPTIPEVVLEGGSIGNTGNVAFFPAAAGLPLYHAY